MPGTPRTLFLQDLPVQCWRNGGGTTREIARCPSDVNAPLVWRLSLADIKQTGAFSSFPGVRRTLVLLDGGGLTLQIADEGDVLLRVRGDACTFDGHAAVTARLHAGPCRVLNLMTAHGSVWTDTAHVSGRHIVAEFSNGHTTERYFINEPHIMIDRILPAFALRQGKSPLLISMPHVGTELPDAYARRMTQYAAPLDDTDWHLEKLYAFATELDASLIVATHSRYIIDLNRPPDNSNLYPGRDTTALCPLDTFDKLALYQPGQEPNDTEIAQRVEQYWRPYHDALATELQRLHSLHGYARLWDAHSIRSTIPRLFEGRLPDLNFGTADGASCRPELADRIMALTRQAQEYSAVLNGRFKGGYITRRYGNPDHGIDAIQLELSQITYMEERPPYAYDEDKAGALQHHLRDMVRAFVA